MEIRRYGSGRPPCWRSRHQGCCREISIRTGTWFEGPRRRVSLRTALLFMYQWCWNVCTVENGEEELGICRNTTVAWNQHLRAVASEALSRNPVMIGGQGLTVELDETLLAKRKYNVGRLRPEQWVFGGICRETGEIFADPVPNRSSATLLDIVRKHVRPGTTIMTDPWRGYSAISRDGFTHLTVNHSVDFVDRVTGAHTQNIEYLWSHLNRSMLLRNGMHRSFLRYYLDETVGRQGARGRQQQFQQLLAVIAAL